MTIYQGGVGAGPGSLGGQAQGGALATVAPQYIPTGQVPNASNFLDDFIGKAKTKVKGAFNPMKFKDARALATGRVGVGGALLAGGLTAYDALQQGRPLEAAVGGTGAVLEQLVAPF